jgi:glycosyltransferase involved in cell wall biosynthesis
MACGKPVVASPVGLNVEIVSGAVGMLCTTDEEWVAALRELAGSASLRTQMGREGRVLVEKEYCLAVTAPRLVTLLREVCQG